MIKKDFLKYAVAFTMGDGGVYYSGKNCRFVANQIIDNRDYIEWRADILRTLTEVNLHESHQEGKRVILATTTRAHPFYTKIRERMYVDSYKSIDPFYVKLLDWEMLAILYMDDGSIYKDTRCNATPIARLNTKRLSYADSWLLKKAIKERLNVEFNVHRHLHRYFLSLRAKDSSQFFDSIAPFIKPSFQYKLP